MLSTDLKKNKIINKLKKIKVSNSLDPDQARSFVGLDLGPNCLQRLSADGTHRHRVDQSLKSMLLTRITKAFAVAGIGRHRVKVRVLTGVIFKQVVTFATWSSGTGIGPSTLIYICTNIQVKYLERSG